MHVLIELRVRLLLLKGSSISPSRFIWIENYISYICRVLLFLYVVVERKIAGALLVSVVVGRWSVGSCS